MIATGGFYDNFTSLMSDTRHGKEFKAFLNNHIGRAYFSNSKDEEGNFVQELSKLIKRCFLIVRAARC